MGDFCSRGFYSNLPIHRGMRAVAFVCIKNEYEYQSVARHYMANTPFIPISLPIRGIMGDYGTFEDVDWDINFDYICKLFDLNEDNFWAFFNAFNYFGQYHHTLAQAIERFKTLHHDENNWNNEEIAEYKVLNKLKDLKIVNSYKYNPLEAVFTIVYEHENVYNQLTWGASTSVEYKEQYEMFDRINSTNETLKNLTSYKSELSIFNPFNGENLMIFDSYNPEVLTQAKENGKLDEFVNDCKSLNKFSYLYDYDNELRQLRPYGYLGLYTGIATNPDVKIADFADLVYQLNTCISMLSHVWGGGFYPSIGGGQDWHHDKQFVEDFKKLYKIYESILDQYNQNDDEEDYDEENNN